MLSIQDNKGVFDVYVYKITNDVNGKSYIGQTIRPVDQRFNRHISDAENKVLDTHFARAIRKYGKQHFDIKVIDVANSQDELNKKEQYWIRKLGTVSAGYNETDAVYKCGGNTYMSKSDSEMRTIKHNLSMSKSGKKNPRARSIKCYNSITGEELFFDTVQECKTYFGEKNHRFVTTRVTGKTKGLYQGVWKLGYADSEYPEYKEYKKKGVRVRATNVKDGKEEEYCSMRLCARECGLPYNKLHNLHYKGCRSFVVGDYNITILE